MGSSYKRHLAIILFCGWLLSAFGQQISYELNTNESGSTKSYIARDFVSLKPGFVYTPSTSDKLDISIDPGLLFIPTENLYAEPDGTISPQGGAVGSVTGQFSVNNIGGATYSIPIECPAGNNDIQPSMSLVYSSMGRNGIMGWGWSLGNLSMISRTGSSLYYDGKVTPLQINAQDNLVLDGQRLLLVSGNNLNTNAKYRTEIENYNDISFKSPGYFEVKTKDGLTIEYGSTTDSKLSLYNKILTWFISKATDANGNYIKYSYTKDESAVDYCDVRLSKIEYGGNSIADTPPMYTINFSYNERPDVQNGYIYNIKTVITRLLNLIEIKKGNTLLYKYNIAYDYDPAQSKVTAIKLSKQNSHYNPTQILWGTKDNTLSTQSLTPIDLCSNVSNQFYYADFNGDGRTDFLVYNNETFRISLYLADSSSNQFSNTSYIQLSNKTEIDDILTADFNGDGFCDFLLIKKDGNNYSHQLYTYNGNSFTSRCSMSSTKKAIAGDFDGDGIHEILNEANTQVLKFNNYSFTSIGGGGITWGTQNHTPTFPNNRYLLDFNGDGKSDVIILHNNGFRIYTLQENGTTPTFALLISGDYPNVNTGIYFGDFNGDGKTDLLTQKVVQYGGDDDNETAIHFSKGNSFETKVLPFMQKYLIKLHIGDYNGDGKSDFACYYQGNLVIGFSTSRTFTITTHSKALINNAIVVSDFNGNGRDDILENTYYYPCNSGMSRMSLYTYGKNDESFYVKEITNGLGQKTLINYKPTFDTNIYTCNNYTYDYPVCFLNRGLKVVNNYSEGSGDIMYETKMKYKNGRVHLQGKGFLGFESVESSNIPQNKVTTTNFSYNNIYYVPYTTGQTETTIHGDSISSVNYVTNINPLGGKRIYTYIAEQTDKDHLTGLSSKKQIIDLDDTGNPLTIKNTKGDITETQNLSYIQKGGWCKNKISHMAVTITSREGSLTRTTDFEYDDQGNIIKMNQDPNHENGLITQYTYDIFGNEIQKDIIANNKKRTTRKTYDENGYFLIREENESRQTNAYEWDQITGLLQSQTDHLGLTTYYKYNELGKLVETIYPTGVRTGEQILWASAGSPRNAKFYRHTETSGKAPVTIWYDPFRRKIQQDSYGLNGNKISVITEYNTDGTVFRESEPFFAGNTVTWAKTYTYDNFKRPVSVITPQGTVSTTYNGATTIVTTPGETRETTINSAGQTVISKHNGKSVVYTYYPSGQIKSTTPEDRPSIRMEYDLQGNRIKLIDPDAGTIYNEYNGFGEMISERQKIHLGQDDVITTYTYSDDGLLQQISRNGENTVYNYDTYHRLSSINIEGQHKQELGYDDLNRIISIKENIKGKIFYQMTEYDRLDRVKKGIYTSGYYTTNIYDEYGNLTQIKDVKNRLIWQALQSNAKGQLTKMKRGDRESISEFDSRGYPVSMRTPGIADMEFSFTDKSNLDFRIDKITGHKETFTYDDLNRLTGWHIYKNNIWLKSDNMTYSPTGTIATTSTLDNYSLTYGEGNSKPDALTSVLGTPSSIPTNDLTIGYTDFKKVKTLSEEDKQYDIIYGVDDQRKLSVYTQGKVKKITRYYIENYEEEINSSGNIRKIHYLPGGAVYIENGRDSLLFLYTDYQNNLLAITDENGNVLERHSFDPWGNRRNPEDWSQKDSRHVWSLNRGYTMHEHLDEFGIINMNGRVYDPLTACFFSPDPFVQAPDKWLNYNRYAYGLNNPLSYIDPSGEIVWFIPVIIGAVVGAYTGASIQSGTAAFWNWKSNAWQGAIAGAFVGATAGGMFSAAIGAAGMTTTATVAGQSINVATKAWGVTSSIINSASINIGMNTLSGGGWNGAWKAGITGAATGAWTATGGFGMVKAFGSSNTFAKLGGKLGYQMIGTAGNSMGNNWAKGEDPFSKVTLGVGPLNLTLGKGQKLLQWQNNLGNIAMNTFGFANLALGGKVNFDWKNLSLNYTGGIIDKFYNPKYWYSGMGAHSVIGNSRLFEDPTLYPHELHHLWQSRSLGDMFLPNYGLQGINAWLRGGEFLKSYNYFEDQAYESYWW